jgi:4-hydroxybenzoate polyprenyltransferase
VKNTLHLIKSFRPGQWTKNLFIFAGLIFSQNAFDIQMLGLTLAAFAVFCALSGSVYTINDLSDLHEDKKHPVKKHRPLASGKLGVHFATGALVILIPAALLAAWLLGRGFFIVSLSYLVLQALYSFYLKRVVILDVFSIAAGFVLRVVAGAVVIDVEISSWLIICTILLSLFLALSKRRHELETLEDEAPEHRKVLEDYSRGLLDQMISVVTASTVVCYALYTISGETVEKFGTKNLIFTVPFVLYGIFRYLYLVHKKGEGGNPENIIVSDIPLIINMILWVMTAAVILYL